MSKNKFSIWQLVLIIALPLSVVMALISIFDIRHGGTLYTSIAVLLSLAIAQILFIKIFGEGRLNIKKMALAAIAINLIAVFIWPITSSDFFSYISQSRVWSIHHLNPYLISYSQVVQDQFYPIIVNRWSGLSVPYGPFLVIITGAISWMGANNFIGTFVLLKLFFAALNIANAFLLYKITKKPGAFYWYAFNPFIIWEFSINGHNDVLLISLMLMAILLLIRNKKIDDYKSIFFMSLSVLTKFITAVLIPPIIITLLKERKKISSRVKVSLISGFIFLITAAICYLPFLTDWKVLWEPILKQGQNEGSSSPLILLTRIMSWLTGLGNTQTINVIFSRSIFLLFYLWVLIKLAKSTDKTRTSLIKYFCWILAALYASCFTWLMPWYFISLIALCITVNQLTQKKIYLSWAKILTFYGIGYYILLR